MSWDRRNYSDYGIALQGLAGLVVSELAAQSVGNARMENFFQDPGLFQTLYSGLAGDAYLNHLAQASNKRPSRPSVALPVLPPSGFRAAYEKAKMLIRLPVN